MKKFKEFLRRILFPPIWITAFCAVLTAVLLFFVFSYGYDNTVIADIIYAFSAYSFCIVLLLLIPNLKGAAAKFVSKVPLADRFFNDRLFKAHISIYISLLCNTVYSVFYAVEAIIQKSYWLSAMAIYNFVFTAMRFVLAEKYAKTRRKENRIIYELKAYRVCGILMLIMSLTMTGIIELLIRDGKKASGEIMAITVAAYTFYCFITALINVFKFKKQKSPILLASKNVCFARALMTLFSLQILMFTQFGSSDVSQHIMNIATGTAICAICVVIAVLMIVRANKKLKIEEGNIYD
ncbi:MAG: hypothetical protein ACI4IE_08325 [Eubacterium sp.]